MPFAISTLQLSISKVRTPLTLPQQENICTESHDGPVRVSVLQAIKELAPILRANPGISIRELHRGTSDAHGVHTHDFASGVDKGSTGVARTCTLAALRHTGTEHVLTNIDGNLQMLIILMTDSAIDDVEGDPLKLVRKVPEVVFFVGEAPAGYGNLFAGGRISAFRCKLGVLDLVTLRDAGREFKDCEAIVVGIERLCELGRGYIDQDTAGRPRL